MSLLTPTPSTTPTQKQALLDELLLEIDLGVQGIAVDPLDLARFGVGSEITEQRWHPLRPHRILRP